MPALHRPFGIIKWITEGMKVQSPPVAHCNQTNRSEIHNKGACRMPYWMTNSHATLLVSLQTHLCSKRNVAPSECIQLRSMQGILYAFYLIHISPGSLLNYAEACDWKCLPRCFEAIFCFSCWLFYTSFPLVDNLVFVLFFAGPYQPVLL